MRHLQIHAVVDAPRQPGVKREAQASGGLRDSVVFLAALSVEERPSGKGSNVVTVTNAHTPIDCVPRTALTWDASGSLTFATDYQRPWEVPYDDMYV